MVSYNNELNQSKQRADFMQKQVSRYHVAVQAAKNRKAKELGLPQLEAERDAAKKALHEAREYHRAVNRLERDSTLENWNYELFSDFFNEEDALGKAIASKEAASVLLERRRVSGDAANIDDLIALVANIQMAAEAYTQQGSQAWIKSQVGRGVYQQGDYKSSQHAWRFVAINLDLLAKSKPDAFEQRAHYRYLNELLAFSVAPTREQREKMFADIDDLITDELEREIFKNFITEGVSLHALNQLQQHNVNDVDTLVLGMTAGYVSLKESIDLNNDRKVTALANAMMSDNVDIQGALAAAENFKYSQSSDIVRYFTATDSSLDKKITASTKAKFDPAALLSQSEAHYHDKAQALESVASNTVKKLRDAGPSLSQCEINLAQTQADYDCAKNQVDAIDSNVLTVLKRQLQKSYTAFLQTQAAMGRWESIFYKTKDEEATAARSVVNIINRCNSYADACGVLEKLFKDETLNMRDRSFPFMLARTLLRKDGGLFALNIGEENYEKKGDAVNLHLDKKTKRLFSGGSDVLGEKVADAQKTSAWFGIFHAQTTPERRALQQGLIEQASRVAAKATCAA